MSDEAGDRIIFLNRYAIVTGGGSGLGRALCQMLVTEGYRVAIVGIHRDGLEETLRLIERCGGGGQVEICDVTDPSAWVALRDRLKSTWPKLDLLVNNAGMLSTGFTGAIDLEEFERVIRLNLFGAVYGCHTMVPWLIESARIPDRIHPPHIVNVASIFAFLSPPGMSAYNVSKAGIVSLSETLRGELKEKGVGVTVACPGPMPTRFMENAHFESDSFRRMTEHVVRESTLQPKRVAGAIRAAIYTNQLYCVVGKDQKWLWRLKRMFPNVLLDRVARRVRKDLNEFKK